MDAGLPQRCHGDDRIPESLWNAGKSGFFYVLLGVEHDGGEDDDGHREREQQETKLTGARLERVAEDAQPLRVSGELEDTEHAEHPQRDERAAEILVVGDAQPDVVRQNRYDVDDAHHRADVLASLRRGVQPKKVLAGEQHDAGRVQTEEFCLIALAARRLAVHAGLRTARHSFGDVGENGQRDEEAGDVVEDERRSTGLRVFESPPHMFAWRCRQVLLHLQYKITQVLKYYIYYVTLQKLNAENKPWCEAQQTPPPAAT